MNAVPDCESIVIGCRATSLLPEGRTPETASLRSAGCMIFGRKVSERRRAELNEYDSNIE
jgi:hypothetical protein